MKAIQVRTQSRIQFVDITSEVKDAISVSGIREGLALVFVPHTTAAVTINEAADPSVVSDIISKLSQMVPHRDNYRHSEGNSDAHIKASLIGSSVNLVISGGALVLGTWQGIFFCEFDGPRQRKVFVKVISGQ
ncbi:MAG: secondary thiamine-phosphate synthase enzyme YjbQ [Deltaproteobacteria bacterium]|jgi:secondary thiamine-phosphate synthase enzyme|nr:secondary thiamine-phosphate synthase enzyme YjbQ [Deltaproteobacteria bacterium]